MYNIDRMRECVINGAKAHPGANIIEKKDDRGQPMRIALHVLKDVEARKNRARELKIGDVVHRHLRDGE